MNFTKNESFKVLDLFKFNDGTTVFVIEFPYKYSPSLPCEAKLILNNEVLEEIKLSSINMPHPVMVQNVLTIGTKDSIKITTETIKQQSIFLNFPLG